MKTRNEEAELYKIGLTAIGKAKHTNLILPLKGHMSLGRLKVAASDTIKTHDHNVYKGIT